MKNLGMQKLYQEFVRSDLEAMNQYALDYKYALEQGYKHTAATCKFMIAFYGKEIKHYQTKLKSWSI